MATNDTNSFDDVTVAPHLPEHNAAWTPEIT